VTTQALKELLYDQETEEVLVVLITISHDDLASPVRVCSDSENITSRSDLFVAYPFEITLPTDDPEDLPSINLRIDNVDRTIVQNVRSITSAPSVLVEVIRASAPDTVEVSLPDFKIERINFDALTVSGSLTLESFLQEPYPTATFDPARFPGGF